MSDDNSSDMKDNLKLYLQRGRDTLLWKLDGLGEYDIRRPMVPTGTNLLGLVKHVASVESEYLGGVFGRPLGESHPWLEDDAEPNADMWATPDESREFITDFYRRVWAHSDETIAGLALEATGTVPWWPVSRQTVTLQRVLIHMIAENERHSGHADILRELIDGAVGVRAEFSSVAGDVQAIHRERLERAARAASGS